MKVTVVSVAVVLAGLAAAIGVGCAERIARSGGQSRQTARASQSETCYYVYKEACGPGDQCSYRCVDPARSDDTCIPCICGCPSGVK